MKTLIIAALCSLALIPALALAEVDSCLLEPSSDVEVGTQAGGYLVEVTADRSDPVREGELLARLNSGVERAAVAVHQTRAEFNRRHLQRTQNLGERQMMSDQELDEIRTDYHLARGELNRAREELALREVRSPLDGIVVERRAAKGDIVQSEPIFRLMALDPLHVEVVLSVNYFGTISADAEKLIWLPEVDETVSARVVNIDRVIDPRSATFRLRLELPNPDFRIPAGLRCEFVAGELEPRTPAWSTND